MERLNFWMPKEEEGDGNLFREVNGRFDVCGVNCDERGTSPAPGEVGASAVAPGEYGTSGVDPDE
ncbi:MAG: hypothetical protein NVSMB70_13780 [Chamaesiphon sp.]